jgi:hypothetical protein
MVDKADTQITNHTVVSLKEYFDKQLASNIETIESKLENIAETAVVRHEALSEATKIKADTLEKRFDNTNEWRNTVMDIITRLATKDDVNTLSKAIAELKEWKDKQEGKASQSALMWTAGIAVVSLVLSVIKLLGGL